GVAARERERVGGTHCAAGQMDRSCDPERVEQPDHVRDGGVHRDHARLLGQPEAALVVAQHAKAALEAGQRVVPALDAAADLVDEHDGLGTAAAQVVAEARAVHLDPVHLAAYAAYGGICRWNIPKICSQSRAAPCGSKMSRLGSA